MSRSPVCFDEVWENPIWDSSKAAPYPPEYPRSSNTKESQELRSIIKCGASAVLWSIHGFGDKLMIVFTTWLSYCFYLKPRWPYTANSTHFKMFLTEINHFKWDRKSQHNCSCIVQIKIWFGFTLTSSICFGHTFELLSLVLKILQQTVFWLHWMLKGMGILMVFCFLLSLQIFDNFVWMQSSAFGFPKQLRQEFELHLSDDLNFNIFI